MFNFIQLPNGKYIYRYIIHNIIFPLFTIKLTMKLIFTLYLIQYNIIRKKNPKFIIEHIIENNSNVHNSYKTDALI